MPYRSVADLPKAQVNQYSGHQQSAFRKAFNSCYDAGNAEGKCFRIAHSAAKRAGSSMHRSRD